MHHAWYYQLGHGSVDLTPIYKLGLLGPPGGMDKPLSLPRCKCPKDNSLAYPNDYPNDLRVPVVSLTKRAREREVSLSPLCRWMQRLSARSDVVALHGCSYLLSVIHSRGAQVPVSGQLNIVSRMDVCPILYIHTYSLPIFKPRASLIKSWLWSNCDRWERNLLPGHPWQTSLRVPIWLLVILLGFNINIALNELGSVERGHILHGWNDLWLWRLQWLFCRHRQVPHGWMIVLCESIVSNVLIYRGSFSIAF